MAHHPWECKSCFENGRSPLCKREDCAQIRRDRDRAMTMAAELHALQEGDVSFWEARAYFIRDESVRDQLADAKERIDMLLLRCHLAEDALKAHIVGRNAHSETSAWKTHLRDEWEIE